MLSLLMDYVTKCKDHKVKIVVIGDTLVDEVQDVIVERICAEAPVPIFTGKDFYPYRRSYPGGAANVCWQMKAWNAEIFLLSVLDTSTLALLEKFDIPTQFSVCVGDTGKNPVKTRLFYKGLQVGRLDWEHKDYSFSNMKEVRSQLLRIFEDLGDVDVVVFSDYQKGLVTAELVDPILLSCRQRTIPVIVDSKCRQLLLWKGVDVFKPNLNELRELSSGEFDAGVDCGERIKWLARRLQVNMVVVTRGEQPPVGIYQGLEFGIPSLSKGLGVGNEVGAGDCFLAHLALSRARGFVGVESAFLANCAGSAYVSVPGRRSVMPNEVLSQLDSVQAKIQSLDAIISIKQNRYYDSKIVFTNGVFDLLHPGHVSMLQKASRLGDLLVVGVNSDESARKVKGPGRPVLSEMERLYLLAGLSFVDYVFLYEEESPVKSIQLLKPTVLVKGSEYKGIRVPGDDLVEEVCFIAADPFDQVHTSSILARIK